MRKYDASYVLDGFVFDLQRMRKEKQSPETILRYIEKNLRFLKNKTGYYRVIWWEEKEDRTSKSITNSEKQQITGLLRSGIIEED